MDTKQCCKCGETKLVTNFCFDKQDKRYQSCCKVCNAKRTNQWQKQLFESLDPKDMLEATFYKMLQTTHSNAKTKKTPFALSIQNLRDMYKQQEGKCYYTGVPMTLRYNGHLDRDPLLISLDQKTPTLGYTTENTVLCCWGVNALKGRHSENILYANLKLLYETAKSIGKL